MLLTTLPVRLGTDVSSKLALFLLKDYSFIDSCFKEGKKSLQQQQQRD